VNIRECEHNCCGQKIAYFLEKEHAITLSVPKIYEILAERYVMRFKWKKNQHRGPVPQASAPRQVVLRPPSVAEPCPLSQERRLSGWFGFLWLGLCWCLKVGRFLDETAPLPLKKHGRRAFSVFGRGLCELQSLLARFAGRFCQPGFLRVLQELCPVR
jgi:hypothetical protein